MDNLLVTGSWGEPHVTSSQQRNFHSGMLGDGQFVMKGMDLTVQDANTVKLDAGFGCMNGADVEVPPGGVTLKIDSGTQAQNRNDLVVLRYERDESGGVGAVESVEAVVIKGSPSSGEAKDPAVNSGSILDGDSPVDMPLWRIPISGLTPGRPEKLFEEFAPIEWPVPISHGGTGATSAAGVRTNLGLGDYITSAGTSGDWKYIKYASGLKICVLKPTEATVQSMATLAGGLYFGYIFASKALPFAFSSYREVIVVNTQYQNINRNKAFIAAYETGDNSSLSVIGKVNVVRWNTETPVAYGLVVIGV